MTKKLTRRRGALSFFIPDLYVHDIAAIDTEMLVDSGIRFVISDIDNTLAPYESPTPPEAALDFYARLEAAGIKLAFVSNNKAARVDLYNGQTHYPAISKGGKAEKNRSYQSDGAGWRIIRRNVDARRSNIYRYLCGTRCGRSLHTRRPYKGQKGYRNTPETRR